MGTGEPSTHDIDPELAACLPRALDRLLLTLMVSSGRRTWPLLGFLPR
jgi:hypothetical protein